MLHFVRKWRPPSVSIRLFDYVPSGLFLFGIGKEITTALLNLILTKEPAACEFEHITLKPLWRRVIVQTVITTVSVVDNAASDLIHPTCFKMRSRVSRANRALGFSRIRYLFSNNSLAYPSLNNFSVRMSSDVSETNV